MRARNSQVSQRCPITALSASLAAVPADRRSLRAIATSERLRIAQAKSGPTRCAATRRSNRQRRAIGTTPRSIRTTPLAQMAPATTALSPAAEGWRSSLRRVDDFHHIEHAVGVAEFLVHLVLNFIQYYSVSPR